MSKINEEVAQQLLTLSPEDMLELINTVGLTAVIMDASVDDRIRLASALLGFSHKAFVETGCQIETVVIDQVTGLSIHYKNAKRVT